MLYKKPDSGYWWYRFTVHGKRYRESTKETKKTAAAIKEAEALLEAKQGRLSAGSKPPTLADLAEGFLKASDSSNLAAKTRKYYRSGWKLLQATKLNNMRINHIATEDVSALRFPGGPSNANCALRTLKRLMSKARERGQISSIPAIKMHREAGRNLLLDEEAEKKLIPHCSPLLRDIVILVRDTGMRNKKELFRMRIEDVSWNERTIYVPDSKTASGRRLIPMSERVENLLMVRCGGRSEGWAFPAGRSKSGHMENIDKEFRKARKAAGLPEKLVLYCGRHDYGTRVLQATGNLAITMRVMGHADTKTAMRYQHPDTLIPVRDALNAEHGPGGTGRIN